jgi:hypothetical protein
MMKLRFTIRRQIPGRPGNRAVRQKVGLPTYWLAWQKAKRLAFWLVR